MRNPVIAAPTYKGYLGADYNYNKWVANLGLQYIHGLYTSVGAQPTKENFCLLNLAVSYRLNNTVTLWVRGENLLAQQYEINLGFPMPGATFMGGVSITL